MLKVAWFTDLIAYEKIMSSLKEHQYIDTKQDVTSTRFEGVVIYRE